MSTGTDAYPIDGEEWKGFEMEMELEKSWQNIEVCQLHFLT